MFRTLLAALLSVSLALPVLTAPAAAHQTGYAHRHDRDNNGRAIAIIGGLAALYLLKRHADRREEKRDDRRARQKVLPDRCFRTFDTRRGVVRGYGARCMQRHVARPGSLPPQCIRQVRTDRGTRNLYTPRCMRRAGWTSRAARR
ncbi:hypothetical protein [Jannaschia marina]|uniref:hypothetical protein n=1 Tax=Jannaschia marina TaxID=2741674 RepID=UPI0015C73CA9|nr:hypothetical protein [Jannaschia marina]